jgi:hypothetical protein
MWSKHSATARPENLSPLRCNYPNCRYRDAATWTVLGLLRDTKDLLGAPWVGDIPAQLCVRSNLWSQPAEDECKQHRNANWALQAGRWGSLGTLHFPGTWGGDPRMQDFQSGKVLEIRKVLGKLGQITLLQNLQINNISSLTKKQWPPHEIFMMRNIKNSIPGLGSQSSSHLSRGASGTHSVQVPAWLAGWVCLYLQDKNL